MGKVRVGPGRLKLPDSVTLVVRGVIYRARRLSRETYAVVLMRPHLRAECRVHYDLVKLFCRGLIWLQGLISKRCLWTS